MTSLLVGGHDDGPEALRALRAWTQFEAGNLSFHRGDLAASRSYLEASAAGWRTVHQQEPHAAAIARTVGTLWLVCELSGQHDDAARARAALEALAATGSPGAQAQLGLNRGVFARSSGRPLVAREQLGTALAFYRLRGDLEFLAITLLNLTSVLLVLGDEAGAEAHATEALRLGHRLRSQTVLANALNDLGEIARYRRENELAERHYRESLELLRRMNNRGQIPRLVHNLGQVALQQGNLERAGALFVESLRLFSTQQVGRGMLEAMVALGALATAQNRPLLAARLWGAAERLGGQPGLDLWPPDQLAYAEALMRARAASASDAFSAAWHAGLGLDWEAARALAEAVLSPETAV